MILEKELESINSKSPQASALNKSLLAFLFLSLSVALNRPPYYIDVTNISSISISTLMSIVFLVAMIVFIILSFVTIISTWHIAKRAKVYAALFINIIIIAFIVLNILFWLFEQTDYLD